MKRMVLLFLGVSLLVSLSVGLAAAEKSSFLSEYEALIASIEARMPDVKSRADYDKLMAEKKNGLEALLGKHASGPADGPMELLRARILVDLEKYAEAKGKLDALAAQKGPAQDEAKLYLAKVLTRTDKVPEAVRLFQQVEARLPRTPDFFEVVLSMAFDSPDDAVRQEYCRKLLAATDLPQKFFEYRAAMTATLAEIEMKKRNIVEAKKILQEGLKTVKDEDGTKWLQSALKQLEFIGKPAPAIAAAKWLNSAPLALESLKGKVVIIDFWAPWCAPCRQVIPTLSRDYNEFRDKGLVVIGFTKLYGRYSDDVQKKGAVGPDEEKALIQGFVERWKLNYPIAISDKGEELKRYEVSGIPTMVFIDKAGNIYDIKVGSGDEAAITAKIRKLLAEK